MSHRNRRQTGYTLIELLVVITITTAIAVPLVTFSIRGLNSYQFIQAQSDTSTELGALSARIGRVIRGTTGVLDAQANTLTIYGYFSPQDTEVKKIRYFISGRNLQIGVTRPSGSPSSPTYDPTAEVVTTTRIDLAMGTTPMFTYYDDVGNQLTGAFQVSQIKQIGLYVAADANVKRITTPIAVQTRLTLRNFKTNL